MRDFGYVEGQNAVIEGRWYGDQVERLPGLAAELIRLEIENRLPAMLTGGRDSVEAGGLVAYGADLGGSFRRAAAYVGISKYVGPVKSFELAA